MRKSRALALAAQAQQAQADRLEKVEARQDAIEAKLDQILAILTTSEGEETPPSDPLPPSGEGDETPPAEDSAESSGKKSSGKK